VAGAVLALIRVARISGLAAIKPFVGDVVSRNLGLGGCINLLPPGPELFI
jgi:hypothetical protein